jgi:hypothetical protein
MLHFSPLTFTSFSMAKNKASISLIMERPIIFMGTLNIKIYTLAALIEYHLL